MRIRLLKLLIIPLLLTLGYLTLASYPYFFSKINRYYSLGPLSLVEEKSVNIQKTISKDRRTDQFDNHLFRGEKVTAKFESSENNFGILLFRFAKLSSMVSDTVVFRIKKEGEKNWHYENNYKADQFQDNQYFPFGFPPIANSKNKSYVFEIESQEGTGKNGIGVSFLEPQVALVYKYSQNDLKNFNTLSSFISRKFVYAARNADFLHNWQLLAFFVLSFFSLVLFMKKKKAASGKKIVNFSKKVIRGFTSAKFYLLFLNTNMKKRVTIGLLIFLFALAYRFSSSLVTQEGVTLFYAGLGGQGDYDQFIRAATCAVRSFCPAILGQNFLFESTVLGIFFEFFGFTGGLKAYLYLMIILSSLAAILPYILLSWKNWVSLGGIFGGLFLATSDFLTHMSLNFPPDNGSLFTFSMFYIVYFLTLQKSNIRWLLLLGFAGTIDALNKALFILNDLVVLGLFVPLFLFEKVRENGLPAGRQVKSIFSKKSVKIFFLSLIPLLVFLIIYSLWEYLVYIKFSANYFLGGLVLTRGENYIYYTSLNESSLAGDIFSKLFYFCVSAVIMLKGLIQYSGFNIYLLVPISLGMLILSFIKSPFDKLPFGELRAGRARKFPVKKFVLISILSILVFFLLILIKNDYQKVHEVFNEYHIYTWTYAIYFNIFLFIEIVLLFILNFKYSVLKLTLPILPYVIILIILAKNSPFPRLHTHVVAWSVILLAYLTDWIAVNSNTYSTKRIRMTLWFVLLISFSYFYMFPKMVTIATQLVSGIAGRSNQVKYLQWVEGSLPANAVILAGGKSDLVTVAQNIKRPIVYNTLYSAALLINSNELPGVKPEDFGITGVRFLYKGRMRIPKVGASDFNIISELTNKDNFRKNKYIILEDDIEIWRGRVSGVVDNVFSTTPGKPHANDYSIKIYKFNPTLKKAIYELIFM